MTDRVLQSTSGTVDQWHVGKRSIRIIVALISTPKGVREDARKGTAARFGDRFA